ncbi:MAG: methyltransferase domain-containing protein [Betaproteobacteria bacterium]|nr:methyltransferase domain-containing protein [Betaproteobacteria bacterium]
MNTPRTVDFFDRQFRRQIDAGEFALNPFEARALPHLRGRVLDLGCGLGNLALAAARRGCEVTALDASPAAIARLQAVARREALALVAAEADFGPLPHRGGLRHRHGDRAVHVLSATAVGGAARRRTRARGAEWHADRQRADRGDDLSRHVRVGALHAVRRGRSRGALRRMAHPRIPPRHVRRTGGDRQALRDRHRRALTAFSGRRPAPRRRPAAAAAPGRSPAGGDR